MGPPVVGNIIPPDNIAPPVVRNIIPPDNIGPPVVRNIIPPDNIGRPAMYSLKSRTTAPFSSRTDQVEL